MAIANSGMFQCKICGHKEFRSMSDAFTGKDEFKSCSKCGGIMLKMKNEDKGFLDLAREGLGKIFK